MGLKHAKKMIAMTLVMIMLFSLGGCAKKTETVKNEITTVEKTETKTDETATEEKKDELVELTTVKIVDSSMKFVDCTADNNVFQDDFQRDVGVKIKYNWIADISQTDAKFATMIASGDVPDYFNVANPSLAFQLINEGYCMDITDIYAKTASEELKARDAAFQEAHDALIVDGKLYGISELGYGIGNELNIVWVRTDWLAESGKEVPKTMDELYALSEYFMSNIEGCSYGISLSKSITDLYQHTAIPIFNAYNSYPKIWMKGESGLEYGSTQKETKDALLKFQELYSRKIIDPEFAVKDVNAVNQDVASGKVGIVCGVNWIGWDGLGGTVSLDTNATWTPIAVPTTEVSGDVVKLQAGWPVGGYWLISKDCKNPEKVVEMMNYFVEQMNLGTFDDQKYKDAGGIFGGSPIYQTEPNFDYLAVSTAIKNKDKSELSIGEASAYDNILKFVEGKDVGYYGPTAQMEAYDVILNTYIPNTNYVLTELRGSMPKEYSAQSGSLTALEDEYFTRIIMGESIDLFDEFVAKWKSSGGDVSTDEMNTVYGSK